MLVFGQPKCASILSKTLCPISKTLGPCVCNLGIIFDLALKFDKQINSVVKSAFFSLGWTKAKVKTFLSFKDLDTVIHAFISIRLFYCNSLYLQMTQSCLSHLLMVKNWESIALVLISLHWLPIEFRIQLKVMLFVYKSMAGLALLKTLFF